MLERQKSRQISNSPLSQDEEEDPTIEEEENWSDVATKGVEPLDLKPKRKSKIPTERLRYHRLPRHSEALKETRTIDNSNGSFESSNYRPPYPGGQPGGQIFTYGNPYPLDSHTQPSTGPNRFLQKPQPAPSYVDPNFSSLYPYHDYPNSHYPATAYPSYPIPPHQTNSYYANTFPPNPQTTPYAPSQANPYTAYQDTPKQYIPPHRPDYQTQPSTNPNFHVEYELEEAKRELFALKREKIRKEEDSLREKEVRASKRKELRRKNKEEIEREVKRTLKDELAKKMPPKKDARAQGSRPYSGGSQLNYEPSVLSEHSTAGENRETRSDPGTAGMNHERIIKKRLADAGKHIKENKHTQEGTREMEKDQALVEMMYSCLDRHRNQQQDGRRYYEELVRTSLDGLAGNMVESIRRHYPQSRPNDGVRIQLEHALVDVLDRFLEPTAAAMPHTQLYMAQNERGPLRLAQDPGLCIPENSSPEGDQFRHRVYQPSNYGGSSALPPQYSTSKDPQHTSCAQCTHNPQRTSAWNYTSNPSTDTFLKGINHDDGAKSRSSVKISEEQAKPEYGKPAERDLTNDKNQSADSSDESELDQSILSSRSPNLYAKNHKDLSNPTLRFPPAPDAPQLAKKATQTPTRDHSRLCRGPYSKGAVIPE